MPLQYKLSTATYNRLLSQLKNNENEKLLSELKILKEHDIFSIQDDKRLTFQAILEKNYEIVSYILSSFNQQSFLEEFIAISLNDSKMLEVILKSPQEDKKQLATIYAFVSIKLEDEENLKKALKLGPRHKEMFYISDKDIADTNRAYFKPKKQLVFETVSLLGYSVYSMNEKIVSSILDSGIKPNEDDFVMLLNFKNDHQEAALNLLNRDKNVKVSQKLFYELVDGNYEVMCIQLLKQSIVPTLNLEKVFERAAENNNKTLLEYLMEEKIPLNFKTSILLQHATEHNNKPLAKYLLDQGAFIDDKVLDKCTESFKNWLEKQQRYESLNINLDKELEKDINTSKKIKI